MEKNEEEIKKQVYIEMIIDKLYEGLAKRNTNDIRIASYKLDEGALTYLIEKYDPNKFKEFKEMLLKDSEADE